MIVPLFESVLITLRFQMPLVPEMDPVAVFSSVVMLPLTAFSMAAVPEALVLKMFPLFVRLDSVPVL